MKEEAEVRPGRCPKPAASSTSSSSILARPPATKRPSARPRRCPTWRRRCDPQGDLLSNYLAAQRSQRCRTRSRATVGQPPNGDTKKDCSDLRRNTRQRPRMHCLPTVVAGSACVYPVETLTLPDELGIGQLHLARPTWRTWSTRNRPAWKTASTRSPGEAARQPPTGRLLELAQPVHLLPLAARPRRLLGQRRAADRTAEKALEEAVDLDAGTTPTSPPAPVRGRRHRPVPGGQPRRRRRVPTPFLAQEWCPRSSHSAAVQERRPTDRHLLRHRQPAAGSGSKAPPERRPPSPATRCGPGALPRLSKFAAPGRKRPTLSAYDPYSLLRSTEELFGLKPAGEGPAIRQSQIVRGPELLGTDGGDCGKGSAVRGLGRGFA